MCSEEQIPDNVNSNDNRQIIIAQSEMSQNSRIEKNSLDGARSHLLRQSLNPLIENVRPHAVS